MTNLSGKAAALEASRTSYLSRNLIQSKTNCRWASYSTLLTGDGLEQAGTKAHVLEEKLDELWLVVWKSHDTLDILLPAITKSSSEEWRLISEGVFWYHIWVCLVSDVDLDSGATRKPKIHQL